MYGDALAMVWLFAAAFLMFSAVRVAILFVKKKIRRGERERLEREGRIIFHEGIDDFSAWEEMKGSFGNVLPLASCFSLIIVVVFPLISFLQKLIG